MNEYQTLHLFFHFVKRPKDFFLGVKMALDLEGNNIQTYDLKVADSSYEKVDKAEYSKVLFYSSASELKIFRRVIGYFKIFREFEEQTISYFEKNTHIKKCFFLFSG